MKKPEKLGLLAGAIVLAILIAIFQSGCAPESISAPAQELSQATQPTTRDIIINYTGSECSQVTVTVTVDFRDLPADVIVSEGGVVPSFRKVYTVDISAYQIDMRVHLLHDIVGTYLPVIVPIPAEGVPVFNLELAQPGCF